MIQLGTKAELCAYQEVAGFAAAQHAGADAQDGIMTHANYLRRQAETLVHLSRATIDLSIAGRLRTLASEFRAKAAELDNASADFAPPAFAGNTIGAENLERA